MASQIYDSNYDENRQLRPYNLNNVMLNISHWKLIDKFNSQVLGMMVLGERC